MTREPLADRPRHILIVADRTSGHRLMYVRLLCVYAAQQGRGVTILTLSGTVESDEWNLHLSSLGDTVNVVEARQITLQSVEAVAHQTGAKSVVIPDGDSWLQVFVRRRWSGPGTLSMLVMRPTSQAPRRGPRRFFETSAKRAARALARRHINVDVWVLAPSASPVRRDRWSLTDPTEFTGSELRADELRSEWQTQFPDTYWFGIVGAISERKNVDLVVDALAEASRGARVGLILAGSLAVGRSTIHQALKVASEARLPIVTRFEPMDDSEFDSLILALDCVVLAHSNEGSSGIFGKALAAGTRVLAAGARSLRTDCRRHPLNASWTRLDREAIAAAAVLTSSAPRPHPLPPSGTTHFAAALVDGAHSLICD